jgi:hypothetical protein
MRRPRSGTKIIVLGMVHVRAKKVGNLSGRMVRGKVIDNVGPDIPLMTDELAAVRGELGVPNPIWSINHSKGAYVRYAYTSTRWRVARVYSNGRFAASITMYLSSI